MAEPTSVEEVKLDAGFLQLPSDEQRQVLADIGGSEAIPPAVSAESAPPDPAPVEIPPLTAAPVPDYDDRVTSLDGKLISAESRFKDGEMTFDEFRRVEREVREERRELDDRRLKHEIASEQREQFMTQRWKATVDHFFRATAAAEGVDYLAKPLLHAALDAEVKRLGRDEANADKPGRWFLSQAHKNVMAQLHSAGASFEDTAHHGAGATVDFAALDRLSGLDLERALAALPADAAERYLNADA
ncbi:MAG: hypothetical protein ACT4P4_25770 [Betaproteobacteria bacterium]